MYMYYTYIYISVYIYLYTYIYIMYTYIALSQYMYIETGKLHKQKPSSIHPYQRAARYSKCTQCARIAAKAVVGMAGLHPSSDQTGAVSCESVMCHDVFTNSRPTVDLGMSRSYVAD